MTGMPWFRLYAEILDDPKIGRLPDSTFRTFIELLCVQCEAGDESGDTGLTAVDIGWRLRRDISDDLDRLVALNVVEVVGDAVRISAWEKRQFKSDSSTERVRKYRAKQSETFQKRYSNALDTDTDTDTEKTTPPNPPPTTNGTPPEFSQWWQAYPKKVAKDAALTAWKKRKPGKALAAEMLSAIESQCRAGHFIGRDGCEYVPNPATWLNQGRWQDEVRGAREQTKSERLAELQASIERAEKEEAERESA